MLIVRADRLAKYRKRRPVEKMSLHVPALRGTFPPFQTQSVEQSPTATPHHTRAGTPIHEKLLDRSGSETNETMAALNALMKPSHGKSEETKMTRVSHIDGSADVSLATKLNFLMVYLVFNLGLTLYNKAVMIQVCANSLFQTSWMDSFVGEKP